LHDEAKRIYQDQNSSNSPRTRRGQDKQNLNRNALKAIKKRLVIEDPTYERLRDKFEGVGALKEDSREEDQLQEEESGPTQSENPSVQNGSEGGEATDREEVKEEEVSSRSEISEGVDPDYEESGEEQVSMDMDNSEAGGDNSCQTHV
jgi:hypothetical protein